MRTPEHNARIGMSVSLTAQAKREFEGRRIWYRSKEVAEILNVTQRTVERLAAEGRLAAEWRERPGGGFYRFRVTDVRKFAAGNHRRIHPTGRAQHSHGIYGYNKYGCRCFTCRKARADYVKQRAERRKCRDALPPGDPRHGKRSSYSDLGCRCELCTRANTDYQRAKRVEKKQIREGKR